MAWAEGGDKRAAMQAAGAAVVAGLGGGVGSAAMGAAGAAVGSKMGGELNELSDSIAASNPTGNADIDKTLGNIVANVLATGAGAVVGGGAGAFSSYDVDRYNRQLHPDERQWAEKSAMDFASVYKEQTGQDLTPEQAQNMLLANGYRLVDAAASKGPGGDAVAVAYISKNAGNLFSATSAEYNSPFLYGNKNGSLTPDQSALPGSTATPATGLAIAGGLVTAGLGPEIVSGAATAVSYGQDLLAAYKAAQAGYSLATAALTGGAVSSGIYTAAAAASAFANYYQSGENFGSSFSQRFSVAGGGAAATVGAFNSMFATSMFSWAGIPNGISNALTLPGFVIRANSLALGQAGGKAAQGAVQQSNSSK